MERFGGVLSAQVAPFRIRRQVGCPKRRQKEPKGSPKGVQREPKMEAKFNEKINEFFYGLWDAFEDHFGLQNGTKMVPKIDIRINDVSLWFSFTFSLILGGKMVPKRIVKSMKNQRFLERLFEDILDAAGRFQTLIFWILSMRNQGFYDSGKSTSSLIFTQFWEPKSNPKWFGKSIENMTILRYDFSLIL